MMMEGKPPAVNEAAFAGRIGHRFSGVMAVPGRAPGIEPAIGPQHGAATDAPDTPMVMRRRGGVSLSPRWPRPNAIP
jgi:hypothetical protein